MKTFVPHKILVEKDALEYSATREILNRCSGIPVEEVENARSAAAGLSKRRDPIGEGKRILLLARDRGRSFKPFPEAEQYLSCDYYTLHVAEGCDLECSYCILQAYLTNPLLTVYVNIEEMLENLQKTLSQHPNRFFRIGTGQLSDSLSLDHLTGFSEKLIPFFRQQENAVLELKTKSTQIDRLLPLRAGKKTIISWSFNSEKIQREEEHKCASLAQRLRAAKQIADTGEYRLGFHFDPVIDYPGWEEDYRRSIQNLFSQIPEEAIAWISLGCLRMMRELKPVMQARFPKSSLGSAEWIHGMDGKLRYFKPTRIDIYRKMVAWIREEAPNVTLYLSMESPEVWQKVFGFLPTRETVCRMLDQSVWPDAQSDHALFKKN